jgi:hypothetical protein
MNKCAVSRVIINLIIVKNVAGDVEAGESE